MKALVGSKRVKGAILMDGVRISDSSQEKTTEKRLKIKPSGGFLCSRFCVQNSLK